MQSRRVDDGTRRSAVVSIIIFCCEDVIDRPMIDVEDTITRFHFHVRCSRAAVFICFHELEEHFFTASASFS